MEQYFQLGLAILAMLLSIGSLVYSVLDMLRASKRLKSEQIKWRLREK